MKRLIPVLGFALFLLGGPVLADDLVVNLADKQQTIRGTIKGDDEDGVIIASGTGAGEARWSPKEVVRAKVRYECLQRHYEVGRSYENAKEYDLAIGKYEEALKDDNVPKYAKQYVRLHIAICWEKQNDPEKAATAYKALIEDMPKTCFKREVAEGLFANFVKLSKWDDASKGLAALESLGDEGKFLASVYRAELLERKAEAKEGEFAKAVAAYQAVAKGNPAPEVLCMAYAGAARCLLMDGQAGDAAEYAKKVLAVKGFTVPAAADAHQVLGESLLAGLPSKAAELAQEKNRERALDAIEEMMRAVLQYKGSSWAEPRAYYQVGLWCERLQAAGAGADWSKRATWAYSELTKKYPRSPWTQKIGKQS